MAASLDLTPDILDLTLSQGTTVNLQLRLHDRDGNPMDLTGKSFVSMARTSYTALAPAFSFTTAVTSPTTGDFTLSLTASEFAAVPAGSYVYDVELVDGTTVQRPIQGTLTVLPEVTR